MRTASTDTRLPIVVYALGAAIFAQGTSELMLAGLLPQMSSDLGVSIPQTGSLVSIFAIGMLLGAPILGMASLRWNRRTALLIFSGVFLLAHVFSALTSSFTVIAVGRFVAAFVYAGFWAVAMSVAVAEVASQRRGKALSIVAGGLALATVIGLPAGSALGIAFGWRSAFWAVAVMTALSAVAVLRFVPSGRAATTATLRSELAAMRAPALWVSYLLTAASIAAVIVIFTYLGALVVSGAHAPAAAVPVVMVVFGIGSVLGMNIGGRWADRQPYRVLVVSIAGVLIASLAMALAFASVWAVGVISLALGFFGYLSNPVLNSRVFGLAPGSQVLVGALSVVAFNIGIAVGPHLGGLALAAGLGYGGTAWIAAAVAAVAMGVLVLAWQLRERSVRDPEPELAASCPE